MKDWNDEFANAAYIHNGNHYPEQWAKAAQQFREQPPLHWQLVPYGELERESIYVFHPNTSSVSGLAIFVHGGYWMAFDASYWSHLAKGALAQGWVVAMPSYTLAPHARISAITQQIGKAINYLAERYTGAIHLAGHSAGGHLVTRMMCEDSPLTPAVQARLKRVLSISGLHDLRPLLQTTMNQTLQLDRWEARSESVALLFPLPEVELRCWVGANERPEFIRQTDLLVNLWGSLNVKVKGVYAPHEHHFSVINDLARADSALVQAWVGMEAGE
ncbi:MAG: alpha/beta hydrolase [Thiofilum sp.]|uniref:alpha/beta hydrolase n=1 Tax=Thiofilum sp. TaxID=2212733 RepID=UPI0025F4D85F|nr:alpha/beta hydrolase [Thiofilum sp.]MBK8455470.1 alpha/beta hydrolase [Thiofilum sp.]